LTRDAWLAEFARRLDLQPPSEREIEQLLDLAAEAAHASERTAAPLACWIAGRSSLTLPELLQAARESSSA
jgi:Domain of unknown function (DUF6457)